MTTPECQKSILDEVLAPHLASEDGQAFLAGQARLERVQVYCAPVNLPNPLVLQLELYFLILAPMAGLFPFCSPLRHMHSSTKHKTSERQRHQILPYTNTNHTHTTI